MDRHKFKNRIVGRVGAFLFGLLLGLSVAFAALAQQRTPSLNQRLAPLLRPANVTELEWGFVLARLSQIEDQVTTLSDSGLDPCCASYSYDHEDNKIIVGYIFDHDSLSRLTVEEAKQRLRNAAIAAIADAQEQIRERSGVKLETKDFKVYFNTVGKLGFERFAVYENEQLNLSDHAK